MKGLADCGQVCFGQGEVQLNLREQNKVADIRKECEPALCWWSILRMSRRAVPDIRKTHENLHKQRKPANSFLFMFLFSFFSFPRPPPLRREEGGQTPRVGVPLGTTPI